MGRVMTIGEVAEKVQMAVSTLRKYVMRKEIPFKKVGVQEQGKVHRMVTGKMLQVVNKKLDLMNPAN
jgi:hypothetical protein